jgi:hypothetical protein
MAARKQLWHPDEVRAKIQASQLLNRLHDHAFGKVELTPAQVRSIEVLLKKAIPDLSAVQMSGEGGGAVSIQIVTGVPRASD